MLINANKNIENGSTVIVILVGGTEVVARLKEQDSDFYHLEKVFKVVMMPDGQGGVQMAMVPFCMLIEPKSDTVYPINKTSVVTVVKAPKEVASMYVSETTGLQIPSSGFSTRI